jgi:hypothetical protein
MNKEYFIDFLQLLCEWVFVVVAVAVAVFGAFVTLILF